jgi:large subunit ribosomal protein L22
VVAKVVKSAAANAENNFQMTPSDLKIVKVFIDEARTLKRFRARARGRVSPILKRSSHITVIVAEQEG